MSIPLPQHVSRKLSQIRKKYKLTQEEVAERAGIGVRYYQLLESPRAVDIRLSTLEKLAKALRLPPSQLLKS